MATNDLETVNVTPTTSSRVGDFFKNPAMIVIVLVLVIAAGVGIYVYQQSKVMSSSALLQARLDAIKESEKNTTPLTAEQSQARIEAINSSTASEQQLSQETLNARLEAMQAASK
jgi:uncharacterized protein HemX